MTPTRANVANDYAQNQDKFGTAYTVCIRDIDAGPSTGPRRRREANLKRASWGYALRKLGRKDALTLQPPLRGSSYAYLTLRAAMNVRTTSALMPTFCTASSSSGAVQPNCLHQ